jgi:hypothetical protein
MSRAGTVGVARHGLGAHAGRNLVGRAVLVERRARRMPSGRRFNDERSVAHDGQRACGAIVA